MGMGTYKGDTVLIQSCLAIFIGEKVRTPTDPSRVAAAEAELWVPYKAELIVGNISLATHSSTHRD